MAPTTAGTTEYTQAEDRLVDSFASSSTFLAWVGAANPTSAKASIVCHVSPETTTDGETEQPSWSGKYPRIKIMAPDDGVPFEINHDATGGQFEFAITNTRWEVEFLDLIDVKTLTEDTWRAHVETVVKIIREAFVTNSDPGRFFPSSISPVGAARIYQIDNVEGSLIGWRWSVASVVQ